MILAEFSGEHGIAKRPEFFQGKVISENMVLYTDNYGTKVCTHVQHFLIRVHTRTCPSTCAGMAGCVIDTWA
jgi:hypothetical protein